MINERPFESTAQMAGALSRDIAQNLRVALGLRDRASFVATGGLTPAPLYRALARERLSWPEITVTLTDERWLPTDSEFSNERMVRETLLTGGAANARFIPLKTADAEVDDAIGAVDLALRSAPRPFDVCLLGIGADGHIASLFPGGIGFADAMAATDDDSLVHGVVARDAAGTPHRLSLTLAALAASRLIVVMFAGAEKVAMYRAARAGEGRSPLRALIERTAAPIWVCWTEVTP